jgi:hypothetical protein
MKLTIYPWGKGVSDLRYFTPQIMSKQEIEAQKAATYNISALTFQGAVDSLRLTLKDAPPGIYFAGNPHSGTYGKWNLALVAAGFKRVPGCALNRVWGGWQSYKGPGSKLAVAGDATHMLPWSSPDGFDKWIHAFYFIKEGLKGFVEMDFGSKFRDLSATSGDADLRQGALGSLWHINYMGTRNVKDVGGRPRFCSRFGRLSKSCGIAMGLGLPECGKELDEEFFTIAAFEDVKKVPEGYTEFLNYGGLRWTTNLKKLDTAQLECPHKMEVLPD